MINIGISQKTWEKIENCQDRVLLYLNGSIGILEDSIYEPEIQETNLTWQPIANNTILIQEKTNKGENK